MKRLIAAPSAGCPQWSVAIIGDNDDRAHVPARNTAVFGDGTTLAAARIAAGLASGSVSAKPWDYMVEMGPPEYFSYNPRARPEPMPYQIIDILGMRAKTAGKKG